MWRLLWLSQLRFLRRTLGSNTAAALGITLGVASVVAVHLVSVQIGARLQQAGPTHLQQASAVAKPIDATEADAAYFELRRRAQRGDVALAGLYPVWRTSAELRCAAGALVPVEMIGVDWVAALTSGAGAAWTAFAPMDANVTGGSRVTALSQGLGARGECLLGDVEAVLQPLGGAADGALGGVPRVYVDVAVAQQFGADGAAQLSEVVLLFEDPWRGLRDGLERLMPGISSGLPAPAVPDLGPAWHVVTAEAQMPLLVFGRSILFNLGALGTLSLVVSWFLIYQAALLWLRRQAMVLQRLTEQGVARYQLRLMFTLLLLALAGLAAAVGIGLGWLLASWLYTRSLGVPEAPIALLSLDAAVVVKALASAFLVALVAGWLAFARLWSSREPRPLLPLVVGLGLVGIGLMFESGLVGAFVAIAAVCVLVLLVLGPLLRLLRRHAARLPGPLLWRLAARELAWYPQDLSVAAGAMVLALGTSIGIGIMVDSFRTDFDTMLAQRLDTDLQIDGPAAGLQRLQRALLDDAAAPKVQRVREYIEYDSQWDGRAIRISRLPWDQATTQRYGVQRQLRHDEVFVNEQFARVSGASPGGSFTLQGDVYRVAGVIPGYGDAGPRLIAASGAGLSIEGIVQRRLDVDTNAVESLLQWISDNASDVRAQPIESIRARALGIFDQTFEITRVLTLIALLVAAVGLYSAIVSLGLLQADGTRLLTVMGLRRAELREIAVVRALALGLLCILCALPLGLAMAWMLCHLVNPRAFGWTVPLIPALHTVALPAAVCLFVTAVTGLMTARGTRAS